MKKMYYSLCLAATGALLLFSACGGTKAAETTAETSAQAVAPTFETAAPGGAEDKVPDSNVPVLSIVSVYFPSEDTGGIVKDMDAIAFSDGALLFYKLMELGAVEGDFISYTQEGNVGTIDLTGFDLGNESQTACLTNTFIENFELDTLNVLIDGNPVPEGQALEYFSDYETIG